MKFSIKERRCFFFFGHGKINFCVTNFHLCFKKEKLSLVKMSRRTNRPSEEMSPSMVWILSLHMLQVWHDCKTIVKILIINNRILKFIPFHLAKSSFKRDKGHFVYLGKTIINSLWYFYKIRSLIKKYSTIFFSTYKKYNFIFKCINYVFLYILNLL